MAVTIKDVARKAKVSVATVSRIINNPELFREETRQKVLAAIESLEYIPNFNAKRMRNNLTRTIGVIAPDIFDTNIAYSGFINGIIQKAGEADCRLIVGSAKFNIDKEREYIKYLYDGTVDGLIFIKPRIPKGEFKNIINAKRAIVVFGIDLHLDNIQSVILDNIADGYRAVEHFYSHHLTKIAFIGGMAEEQDYDHWDRLTGFRKAMADYGLAIDESLIEKGYYCEEGGRYAFQKFMNRRDPPEAILCVNDKIAFGVLKAAQEAGVKIPDQLKVIGFDNTPMCCYTSPTVTSFDPKAYKIGTILFTKLMANLERRESGIQNELEVLNSRLILRESCGCSQESLPEPFMAPDGSRIIINDNVIGEGKYQFKYIGTWNYSPEPEAYQEDNHWSICVGSYCRMRFEGTRLMLFAARDPRHGIAAISIDNGPEVMIDFFSVKREDNVLLYTSPELPRGEHSFNLRVTGLKNPLSFGPSISIDKVEVIL